MRYILFVDSAKSAEEVFKQIGDNVEMVYDLETWIENYPSDVLPESISIPNIERYSQMGGGTEYQAIIAIDTGKRKGTGQFGFSFYFRLSLLIASALKKQGVDFFFFPKYSSFLHITGKFPNVSVIPPKQLLMNRMITLDLIFETIKYFPNEFNDKELDIWIEMEDSPFPALAQALDLNGVFAYCMSPMIKDRVIAIPDYDTCYNEEKFFDKNRTYSRCKEVAATSWQENKIFWRGSLFTSHTRRFLFELGKKYPQYLQIEDSGRGQYVHMIEQAKYKYLLDTRGNSFSSRLQTLLKLGRVLFIVDRPFREWYFDRMIPMVHYVPVKEDMSDLIEKYFYMERHPELYDKIVHNLAEFVEENLNPRRILFDVKEMLLKYGVVQK